MHIAFKLIMRPAAACVRRMLRHIHCRDRSSTKASLSFTPTERGKARGVVVRLGGRRVGVCAEGHKFCLCYNVLMLERLGTLDGHHNFQGLSL